MRRAAFVGLAVGLLLLVFGQAAVGEGSGATAQGQIRFMGSRGCTLGFGFKGFPAGSQGQVALYHQGSLVHTFVFDVPTPSGVVTLQKVGTYIPHPPHQQGKRFHGAVGFQATVVGSQQVLTGSADITCYCAGEGGSGGSGGSGSGLGDAPPASPVSGQPGFTG